MTLQKNFSTQVSDLNALKRIAARAGYVQTRGPEKGEGSVRALLEALIEGEVSIVQAKATRKAKRANVVLDALVSRGVVQGPPRPAPLDAFDPVAVEGEPVSEMIIRERR